MGVFPFEGSLRSTLASSTEHRAEETQDNPYPGQDHERFVMVVDTRKIVGRVPHDATDASLRAGGPTWRGPWPRVSDHQKKLSLTSVPSNYEQSGWPFRASHLSAGHVLI